LVLDDTTCEQRRTTKQERYSLLDHIEASVEAIKEGNALAALCSGLGQLEAIRFFRQFQFRY
jgi:hypothetical protein